MEKDYILHILTPEKHVSPFDVNTAVDAGYTHVIPYTHVTLIEVASLVEEAIFSRDPQAIRRTALFIGGRDVEFADDMSLRAKAAMQPHLAMSMLTDPSGAATTAAVLVALTQYWLKYTHQQTLENAKVVIFGGTGAVGMYIGTIAARCKANVFLASHRGRNAAQSVVDVCKQRYQVSLTGVDSSSPEKRVELVRHATVVVNAAKAGVHILTAKELQTAKQLAVVADLAAVPPTGIRGVDVADNGKIFSLNLSNKTDNSNQTVGIGGLVINNLRYQVQQRLLQQMRQTEQPVYLDFQSAFVQACQLVEEQR